MPLLTLQEAKRQLEIDSTSHDAELQLYVDSLTSVIEGYVGVVEQRSVTDVLQGGAAALALLHPPVLSLTSAVAGVGDSVLSYDITSMLVDGPSGVVRRVGGGSFASGPWTVEYVAGRSAVPPTIQLAALLLLQHLWRTRYGASRGLSGIGGGDDFSVTEPVPGFGYAVPNRVLQLLEPFKQPPGVA